QQLERLQILFSLGCDSDIARRRAVAQRRQHRFGDIELRSRRAIAATRALRDLRHAPLEAVEIGQHQLGLYGLGVADWIDRTFDMDDAAIGKTAQHMRDRVDLANVAKKLVAEPFTARGAADQPGDIDEFELDRDDLWRFREARGDLEPFV